MTIFLWILTLLIVWRWAYGMIYMQREGMAPRQSRRQRGQDFMYSGLCYLILLLLHIGFV